MEKKYFNVNNPTNIIKITSDKGTFYELSDGNMIKKDAFKNKFQPVLEDFIDAVEPVQNTPQTPLAQPTATQPGQPVDVDSFLNSTSISNDVIDGIKNSDSSKATDTAPPAQVIHKPINESTQNIPNYQNNDSLVKQVENDVIPNNTNTDTSQYRVFDNDDDSYQDFVNKSNKPKQPIKPQVDVNKETENINMLYEDEKLAYGIEEANTRRDKRLKKLPFGAQSTTDNNTQIQNNQTVETQSPIAQPPQIDPTDMMFSTFKRNHDISINVTFDDRIGSPDFVKMMVENMEGDIVGYYKKKIMENIMGDLDKISIIVEDAIRYEIFGEVTPPTDKLPGNLGTKVVLIKGGLTKGKKQKYKYLNEGDKVVEVLPNTAKKKGYKPYKKQ